MAKGKSRKGPHFIKYMGPTVEALKELGGSGRPAEVIDWIANALDAECVKQCETTHRWKIGSISPPCLATTSLQ